ncbi:lactamase [Phellopilus nigrolimitatus]|nr:lactamase [Phellopilus nigrolimitatus]
MELINPGKFTLQGTNTYLVGQRPPYILIDTGEGRDSYPSLLESALQANSGSAVRTEKHSCLVSDIVVTHKHHDHFGGLADVLKLLRKIYEEDGEEAGAYSPPRIHKYPSPASSTSSTHEDAFQTILSSLPTASYTASPSGAPIHDLSESQHLQTSDGSASLEVLHTPGHTTDSICLLLRSSERPHALFSADSVLGQGTAVFEDLGAYIRSLQRVLAWRLDTDADADFAAVYPGHGPVVEDGPALIAEYIKHRMDREAQIVDVLSGPPPASDSKDGTEETERPPAWTIWGVVAQIYKDYPESLWLPAAHGVGLHLKKLEGEGRARYLGGEGVEQRWVLVSKL